jgi:glycosyltransferase involved in cell wall biosynthesis
MKLLFLSNFFPPYTFGGYEEWCQEVALGLRQRGHEVTVLTSNYRRPDSAPPTDPDWVRRDLHLEMPLEPLRNSWAFFTERHRNEQGDLAYLHRLIETFRPDAALVWGMWNIPRSIPAAVEARLGPGVAYYLGDYWPALPSQHGEYWNSPANTRLSALPKTILRPIARRQLARETQPPLELRRAMVPTHFIGHELTRRGLRPQRIDVVPGAIDTAPYLAAGDTQVPATDGCTLLYVGRLAAEKGVHIAIEALGQVIAQPGLEMTRLLIAGAGSADYEAQLRAQAASLGITDHITWRGRTPKEALPALYSSADCFLFTSIWPEPFGRVIIEAMATGTAVVGAPVGGAAEILRDGDNALTFVPGDAADLAAQVTRLLYDPALRQRLVHRAQAQAAAQWNLGDMVASIEQHLLSL